ncbi:hypothetical protein ACFLVH_02105 [Chloroflexota bacterium]
MVTDPGETLRAVAYKPLNTPDLVQVEEDAEGLPLAVREKRRQRVETIDDCWRLDDEWWRPEPVSRLYYVVRLASGRKTVIYKDLTVGSWYRQSY